MVHAAASGALKKQQPAPEQATRREALLATGTAALWWVPFGQRSAPVRVRCSMRCRHA
jgi:hypothetical protein